MTKQRPIALLAFILFATLGYAQEVVTTSGSGVNERAAIKHALAEAVCRINGATLETKSTLRQEVRDVIDGVEVEFSYQTLDELNVQAASIGHIRSYELLSSAPSATGVDVSVRSVVLRFDPDNPRPGQKKTVVVERFEIAEGALQLENEAQGEGALLSFLQDGLTTRLVKSRKFTVLTRKNLSTVLKEQAFLRGQGVAPAERIKLSQLLGADYLVAGRIDYLAIKTESKPVKLTGYLKQGKRAELRMTLTIYNVGSGAIEWEESYTENYSWGDAELKRDPAARDDGALARSMIEVAAEDLGKRFLKRTFPPRVMLIDSSSPLRPVFYLNVGESLVELGEEFDLVRPGAPLIDPDTGDVLGKVEEHLGRLVVTKVTAKLSHAMLVNPEVDLLESLRAQGFDPTELVCLAAGPQAASSH